MKALKRLIARAAWPIYFWAAGISKETWWIWDGKCDCLIHGDCWLHAIKRLKMMEDELDRAEERAKGAPPISLIKIYDADGTRRHPGPMYAQAGEVEVHLKPRSRDEKPWWHETPEGMIEKIKKARRIGDAD